MQSLKLYQNILYSYSNNSITKTILHIMFRKHLRHHKYDRDGTRHRSSRFFHHVHYLSLSLSLHKSAPLYIPLILNVLSLACVHVCIYREKPPSREYRDLIRFHRHRLLRLASREAISVYAYMRATAKSFGCTRRRDGLYAKGDASRMRIRVISDAYELLVYIYRCLFMPG